MTGKPKSEEWKAKISAALKGKSPSNKGKHHSEVTKAKMSATRKNKSMSEETKAKISITLKRKAAQATQPRDKSEDRYLLA